VPARNEAWILATDSDPALRDPARAAVLMKSAIETHPSDPALLETLAAAYAAAGDFARAAATVRAAQEHVPAGDAVTADRLRAQEMLYRAVAPGRLQFRTV
jgi:Flp pilus assembly protein TadD